MNSKKVNIICRFGSFIVHSCHRDVLSTVALISLLPRSSTLLERSLGRGHYHHRCHADSVVAHKGGVIHNCQHLPTSTESTNLGEGGGLRRASVLFLKC